MDTPTSPGVGPAPRCQCCPRELHGPDAANGRGVCLRCEARLAGHLADVGELWKLLPGYRLKTVGGHEDTERVTASGPPGSEAPGNLDTLNLLAGGVVSRLIVHEDAWRRALRWSLTPWRGDQDQTLTGVLAFLRANLRWACHDYDDVDGLARDLAAVLREMRAVITGDRRRLKELAVPCPLADQTAEPDTDGCTPACGGVLVYDPQASRIRCLTCRASFDHLQWADLALSVGALAPAQLPTAA